MVEQLTLRILCLGLLLLWATNTETFALSDLERDVVDCSRFKCPDKPDAAEVAKCPDHSSMSSEDEEESDMSESDYQFRLVETLPLNNQNREKRDTASGYIDHLKLCCGATESHSCSCDKCAEKPQCKLDQVLLELSQGTGKPGNCCSKYECGPEPTCEEGVGSIYWLDSCTKCHSCNLPPCTYVCNPMELSPPGNCLSDDNQAMLNGESWTQGNGCEKCTCKAGEKQCTTPYCKRPECENAIIKPGDCCPSCPDPEPTPESTKAPTTPTTTTTTTTTTPCTTTTTTEAFGVSTEGAVPLSSSSTEISTMETTENATETIMEENTINENPMKDQLAAEMTSTAISSSDSSISEENEFEDTTTTASTIFSTQEITTEQSDTDNKEIDSSNISSTSSPMKYTKSVATSAPAAQMPESTSWHRDSTVDDADYRLANKNHSDAVHQSNEELKWMIVGACSSAFVLFSCVYFVMQTMKQRKYYSVPGSDSNISEQTNLSEKPNAKPSDLRFVRIEQPYQKQKKLDETLE